MDSAEAVKVESAESGRLDWARGMDIWLSDRMLGVAIIPVALGSLGWWTTHWVANPILATYRLRFEAVELVFRTVNINGECDRGQINGAKEMLRALAARLSATHTAAIRPVRWALWKMLGIDLPAAVKASLALSNSFADDDDSRAVHRRNLEAALRLVETDDDEYADAVRKMLGLW